MDGLIVVIRAVTERLLWSLYGLQHQCKEIVILYVVW